jgi:hypothetical protein
MVSIIPYIKNTKKWNTKINNYKTHLSSSLPMSYGVSRYIHTSPARTIRWYDIHSIHPLNNHKIIMYLSSVLLVMYVLIMVRYLHIVQWL